jgi:HPt (histidine-containing phosphotransfer) domain-containing protein
VLQTYREYLVTTLRARGGRASSTIRSAMTCTSTDQTDIAAADGSQDSGQPVLDNETLQQLSQLDPSGQDQLIGRVLRTYELSLQKAQVELREAMASNDLRAVGRLVHTLRSSSASVGALGFSARCRAAELAIREGHSEGMAPRLVALERESREVAVAIRRLLVAKGYPS